MQEDEKNIIDTEIVEDDIELDISLRPKKMADYIGQMAIKENLSIFISAAKKRGEAIEHIPLY
jgi:Holliday junction DNA helicase RuvB